MVPTFIFVFALMICIEKMASANSPSSVFNSVEFSPYDDAFKVLAAFADDPHPEKVSLGAGVYRDDNAQPWTLSSVKKVSGQMHSNTEFSVFRG